MCVDLFTKGFFNHYTNIHILCAWAGLLSPERFCSSVDYRQLYLNSALYWCVNIVAYKVCKDYLR